MATKKSKNPLTAMTAGCIAGGVEATAVWPMEFIKVRRAQSRIYLFSNRYRSQGASTLQFRHPR